MRVAVLGAGYAGVVLTRRLERALSDDVDLVVVDESATHLVQHELHRVIRRPGFADHVTVPLDDLFDRASIRQATVVDVDAADRRVAFADGSHLEYDAAAICLGARTDFHGLADVERHAVPLKRVPHAREIRADALDAFETGDASVVVAGAGLAGVQVAGELAALARDEGVDADVVLVEQEASVAPSFPDAFQRAVREELGARGVDVRTGWTVSGASPSAVRFADRDAVPTDVFVWTGGIRGTDALGGDRPTVNAALTADDRTFVVGDAARVVDEEGRAVPASAQTAVQEATVAARNVARVVTSTGDAFRPRFDRFTFDSPGWLVSVGDGAVAQVGGTVVRGEAANALKAGVGVGYLASAGALRNAVSLARSEFGFDEA